MIARTNAKGEIHITAPSRKKELRALFKKMLEDDRLRTKFTKTLLQGKYDLSRQEATRFIQFAADVGRLFTYDKITQGWEEIAYHVNDVAPTNTNRVYYMPWSYDRHGKSRCDRCHSLIPGHGRHNKTRRGHPKEECDLAMVDMLHQI